MKICIIKNRHKKKLNWTKGIQYFADNTPLKLEVDEISTDFDFTFKTVGNDTFKNNSVVGGDYLDKLRTVIPKGKYAVVCLVYGNKSPGIRAGYSEKEALYPGCYVIQIIKDDDKGMQFNHELFHVFFKKLKEKGIVLEDPLDKVVIDGVTHAYFKNTSLTANPSNRTIALDRLKPHWNALQAPITAPVAQPSIMSKIVKAITPKTHYLYFKESEIVGLKPELVAMLDRARDYAEIPFKLNSTLRTVEENKKAGGVENSAHLTGEACDIDCTDSASRYKIVTALLKVGFIRIGIAETFVHCDISKTHPQNNIWLYK